MGETSMKLGEAQEAVGAYASIAKLDPDDIDAQLKLATFYLLGRKTEEAREKLELILQKEPENIKALVF